jgi:hypothetical protein
MKNLQKSRIPFIFISVIVCAALLLLAPACSQKAGITSSDAYNYPIKPGTDAWKALGSHVEMLKACQIPETKLHTMSTKGLLETVLNYPLFNDVSAYNFPQQGFDTMASQFNGIPELLNRKDVGTVLLAKYKTADPATIGQEWTGIQKGYYVFSFIDMETLLAQKGVMSNFNEAQCQDLVRECLAKINAKHQSEMYGGMSQESCLWVITRVLEQVKYEPFVQTVAADRFYQDFVARGSYATDDVTADIYNEAEGYLNAAKVNYLDPCINNAPAAILKHISPEDWLNQHKDSNDPTDIALIKYYLAIGAYRSAHPEISARSDWGIDYTGELNILTDLGVAGLPGLLKEADVNSPFVIPVIFAIDAICKTDFSFIDTFSPEQVYNWKLSFNNKLSVAKDIVAEVVQALRNNASVNDEEINNLLADAGIFALPYFYDEIVNKSNLKLIPYAGPVLPSATMAKFDLTSGSNEKDKVINALKSCQSEIDTILSLTAQ